MDVSPQAPVLASVEDLTPQARIRNAALELFARRGIEGTTVRAVAKAAGVSPGLVQHYFPSKADLQDAVDRYVVEVSASAFADLPGGETSVSSRVEAVSRRVTGLFQERALGSRYVARGLVDRDERALATFDALFEITARLIEEDVEEGRAQPELDQTWAVLHVLVYHFGVVLLEHAINRHLPDPIRSEQGLERWRQATSALYRRGIFRD